MYRTTNTRILFCLAGALALAGLLVGCEPPAPADPQDDDAEAPIFEIPEEDPVTARPTALDIGDVEAQVWLQGTLDPDMDDPGIHAQAMVDRRQRRNMVRIQVEPPYPDELWLHYETTCERNFPDTPAVIRGSFVRDVDGAELGRLAGVFGEDGVNTQYTARIDALEGLEEIPESFLITFEGEALLLESDVDEADVDPEEAETTPGRRSDFVYCNPVRVIFLEDEEELVEDPPEAEEPPVEPEPEDVEPPEEVEPEPEVTEDPEPEPAEEPEPEEDPEPDTPEETEPEEDEAPEPEDEDDENGEPADEDNGDEDNGENGAA